MSDLIVICQECGMPCTPTEFHPFAACLMFKGCHDSDKVRANLAFLATHAGAAAAESGQIYWHNPENGQVWSETDVRFHCKDTSRWTRVVIPAAALTSAPAVPEAIKDADELELFEMTVEHFEDNNETSTDYATLMRWARMGLLGCSHFTVTPEGKALIKLKGVQPGEK